MVDTCVRRCAPGVDLLRKDVLNPETAVISQWTEVRWRN
jgi:hypothetical protein